MTDDAAEEFTLTVLGSGGPVLDTPRASPGFMVQVGGEARLLLDARDGTGARVGETGIGLSTLDAACFSHLHIDHTASFPILLKTALFEGLDGFDLYGPTSDEPMPGTADWLDRQFDAEEGTYRYLHRFAEDIADGTLELAAHEIDATVGTDDAPVTVVASDLPAEAIPGIHEPAPTLADRVSHDDRSITVATDLDSTSDNLPRLAADIDVLVHGAALSPAVPDDAPPTNLHSFPVQVAANARETGADTLVMVHLMPPAESDIESVVDAVREGYDGTVNVAEDRIRIHGDGAIE